MKNYTDLEQSKKLAKILPLESADMWYHGHGSPWESEREYDNDACPFHSMRPNWDKPSWSLAALLEEIPEVICFDDESDYTLEILKEGGFYYLSYGNSLEYGKIEIEPQENFVDTCVAMIGLLHERKLL